VAGATQVLTVAGGAIDAQTKWKSNFSRTPHGDELRNQFRLIIGGRLP
jgi:hypothetical protein